MLGGCALQQYKKQILKQILPLLTRLHQWFQGCQKIIVIVIDFLITLPSIVHCKYLQGFTGTLRGFSALSAGKIL